MKKPLLKIITILTVVLFSWSGLSAVCYTLASMSDMENSIGNNFTAGTLDFILSSTRIFDNVSLSPGNSVTGSINIVNLGNDPKYKVKTANFSGALCDYLNLEANLDGGDIEYSGKLIEMDFGPVIFEDPDDWIFSLSLSEDFTDNLAGENCIFDFVFYGSQTRNDLTFGSGFSDEESANNMVTAKTCFNSETHSCGYWKNNFDIYELYLPQILGDETINSVAEADNTLRGACGSCGCGKTMRGKMKGQLLAMKFNIAHFGVGDYFVESKGKTINEIVSEADDLLRQNPAPPDSVLEVMKNILDFLNNDLQIIVCSGSPVGLLGFSCSGILQEEEIAALGDISEENSGTIKETGEIASEPTEEIIEETSFEETTNETPPTEENQTTEENQIIEEQPIIEENTLIIEEQSSGVLNNEPILQTEPVIMPEDSFVAEEI